MNIVLNDTLTSPHLVDYSQLTAIDKPKIIGDLFEQLLIFDKVRISVNRINSQLFALIYCLGLETVEKLIERKCIEFMAAAPVLVSSAGTKMEDGTVDETSFLGKPPVVGGMFSKADFEPEQNISAALRRLEIPKHLQRRFVKKAAKCYIRDDESPLNSASYSANLVIDAYRANNLVELGLPFENEPEQLTLKQRGILLELGSSVLDSYILAKHNLKSYNNYEHLKICEQNLANIGKAFKISSNTSTILEIEKIPDLKSIYTTNALPFDSVFKIRHMGIAKYYRDWINNVGEDKNAKEITYEYLQAIKNKNRFFNTDGGKWVKNGCLFLGGLSLSAVLSDLVTSTIASYSLGILDTFWLDKLLQGGSPSFFIDDLRDRIKKSK